MRILSPVGLAILLGTTSAFSDTIVLGADPWCPYNCEPGSDRPGYMVEVAREALEPFGHTVEYKGIAWARALAQAEAGQIHGVIGAVPEEAPGFVFGPAIGTYEDTVVFRAGEAVDVEDPAALEGLRVGAINGYEYYGPVSDYINENREDRDLVQYASGDDALMTNLRKLVAGRLDIVAEVRAVLDYSIAQLDRQDEFEVIETEDADDIFIAFSPALESSQLYADQLAQGVARLIESGRYDEILASYGLSSSAD